ncbi:MAG: Asp/Glu racemase [Ahrensia sp.]|nr:Asp/Glu racemase [Ahrensia sp.]
MSATSPSSSNVQPGYTYRRDLPFSTKRIIGADGRIGLIILASDYTLEHEFRLVLQELDRPGLALYHARIANDPKITVSSLRAMEASIADMADTLLPGDQLDVISYCCTSASFVLGPARIDAILERSKPGARKTNPASAAIAALKALEAKRVAVLTPYADDINKQIASTLTESGFTIAAFGSFSEEHDAVVSQITAESVFTALETLIINRSVDAAFVSCTSIGILLDIAAMEARLGIPVVSSNQALAWHCLRLAGCETRADRFGKLFSI